MTREADLKLLKYKTIFFYLNSACNKRKKMDQSKPLPLTQKKWAVEFSSVKTLKKKKKKKKKKYEIKLKTLSCVVP